MITKYSHFDGMITTEVLVLTKAYGKLEGDDCFWSRSHDINYTVLEANSTYRANSESGHTTTQIMKENEHRNHNLHTV
jgi:hypothetical protein